LQVGALSAQVFQLNALQAATPGGAHTDGQRHDGQRHEYRRTIQTGPVTGVLSAWKAKGFVDEEDDGNCGTAAS